MAKHSMRAGCAVTLALTGSVDMKGMRDHIGWFSKRSTDYYSRSSKLIDSGNVANALAMSVNNAKAVEMNFKLNADFTNLNRLCDSSCYAADPSRERFNIPGLACDFVVRLIMRFVSFYGYSFW